MSKQEPYSFVVLRYVHNVVLGEFMNVGLVMYAPDSGKMLAKANPKLGRIKGAFPDLDSKSYRSTIHSIAQGMKCIEQEMSAATKGHECKTALDCARLVLPVDDSALQWSHVGYGLTPSIDKEFSTLFDHLVTRYDRLDQRHINENDIWRKFTSAIRQQKVEVCFKPIQIAGNADKVKFRHAWKNGCWQAYEPLSFDLSAEGIKDKARRWLGQLTAVKDGAKEDVHVHFIVGPPKTKNLIRAYENALEILDHVPFEHDIHEDSQVDQVVQTMKAAA